jgi:FPC/CPF motif-containing protein YcgG
MMDGTKGGARECASPWTDRVVLGDRVGSIDLPAWLAGSYTEFQRNVTHPAFPCYFGTQAETKGEMFYSFVDDGDLSHLPATMAKFAQLSRMLENQRNNFAVFFQPDDKLSDHDEFRALCWRVLQYLHDHDENPQVLEQPDPSEAAWEYCFAGMQMFVVGCSPTYLRRRSRNIGPGVVMLFQPRSVFIDQVTNREISIEARAAVRKRLIAWDNGVEAHPDLGVFGDADNREWKQYFLPDGDEPVAGTCPFLARRANDRVASEADSRGVSSDRDALRERTIVDIVRARAGERPADVAVRFLLDGEAAEDVLSNVALDVQARMCAVELLRLAGPGDRALLLLPSGLDYVVAFLGCPCGGHQSTTFRPPPGHAWGLRTDTVDHRC